MANGNSPRINLKSRIKNRLESPPSRIFSGFVLCLCKSHEGRKQNGLSTGGRCSASAPAIRAGAVFHLIPRTTNLSSGWGEKSTTGGFHGNCQFSISQKFQGLLLQGSGFEICPIRTRWEERAVSSKLRTKKKRAFQFRGCVSGVAFGSWRICPTRGGKTPRTKAAASMRRFSSRASWFGAERFTCKLQGAFGVPIRPTHPVLSVDLHRLVALCRDQAAPTLVEPKPGRAREVSGRPGKPMVLWAASHVQRSSTGKPDDLGGGGIKPIFSKAALHEKPWLEIYPHKIYSNLQAKRISTPKPLCPGQDFACTHHITTILGSHANVCLE